MSRRTGFQVPSKQRRQRAVGDLITENDKKLYTEDENLFKPIAKPKSGDWLHSHKESAQTFHQYSGSQRAGPWKRADTIALYVIGEFEEGKSPAMEDLQSYCSAFFGLKVRVEQEIGLDSIERCNINSRIDDSGNLQLDGASILEHLDTLKPENCFCKVAVTCVDIWPGRDGWNFVFGLASPDALCGVFSFARYNPHFFSGDMDEQLSAEELSLMLLRSVKVLGHELLHIYGIKHCCYFNCLMQGSNHLDESDSKPVHLCPMCLRKLMFSSTSIELDPLARYAALQTWFAEHGFEEEANWYGSRIESIGTLDPPKPRKSSSSNSSSSSGSSRSRPWRQKTSKKKKKSNSSSKDSSSD